MSTKYTCNLELTEDQKQNDQIYGIYESERRALQMSPAANHFSFQYHYYYESESGYVMTTQISNDTKFEGHFQKEGNKVIANITSGTQKADDKVGSKSLFDGNNLAGKIEFIEDGDNLKVVSVDLKPDNLNRKGNIVSLNQVFKKK